jgi:hypothetical protein
MGDRFVLIRSDSIAGRVAAGNKAIQNTGAEKAMRAELAAGAALSVTSTATRHTSFGTTRLTG